MAGSGDRGWWELLLSLWIMSVSVGLMNRRHVRGWLDEVMWLRGVADPTATVASWRRHHCARLLVDGVVLRAKLVVVVHGLLLGVTLQGSRGQVRSGVDSPPLLMWRWLLLLLLWRDLVHVLVWVLAAVRNLLRVHCVRHVHPTGRVLMNRRGRDHHLISLRLLMGRRGSVCARMNGLKAAMRNVRRVCRRLLNLSLRQLWLMLVLVQSAVLRLALSCRSLMMIQ
ncbi:hypothetical protein H310_03402 [Aphanomyces invadans]|uniref:Uncharacterized protein n=1 Tax=Aphanomyces invadans TaxID=157072 RepID=A0A024UJ76_9STRA|nr:hypothetical protein H310_03402 [Aphanomyces invadans]ETW05683.1 hypothetical protein H310_03402 [Aphanomyces invadans]|eukprot:XP_008865460.1 hypothetical protein H310_03402 [Aphanomyces invadans]